jgi:hypothetical protein
MDTLLQVATSWILPAIFFWFLFSFLAMTIIEGVSMVLKFRQKGLQEVIQLLLGEELAFEFNNHTLVYPLAGNRPAYISESLFAKVILSWLLQKTEAEKSEIDDVKKGIQKNIEVLAQKDDGLGDVLKTITTQAVLKARSVSQLLAFIKTDLEAWFIEAVEQMSSVYRARLQGVTLLVGLVVAAVTNFDLINMTARLWETSKYNDLIALAEKTGQMIPIDTDLFTMLPVGWYSINTPSTVPEWIIKIVGIYLGAFFIAVGSQIAHSFMRK